MWGWAAQGHSLCPGCGLPGQAPPGAAAEGCGAPPPGSLVSLQRFPLSPLEETAAPGAGNEGVKSGHGWGRGKLGRGYQLGLSHLHPQMLPWVLLGVIRHLYLCGRCDGGIGVTGGGVIRIQLPVGRVQRLGGWVARESCGPRSLPPQGCWRPWPGTSPGFCCTAGLCP